jgi:dienelactone hydrolase
MDTNPLTTGAAKAMSVGDTVSHYRIVERLGGGGMGVVYKAVDTRLNRTVALKFLSRVLNADDDAIRRFRHEAQAASALDHPNICNIHEIDETATGHTFLAMSYYDGRTVKQRIDGGPIPLSEVLDIGAQVARGLAKAHAIGIIHRDIKPANLIMTSDGIVKILDFGIAKAPGQADLTQTGMMVGTAAYMAPEQVSGGYVDHRADLWALGVVLYEMITGRLPFGADDASTQLQRILIADPPALAHLREGVPPALQHVVSRLLSKRCDDRHATAAELLDDLAGCDSALRDHGQSTMGVPRFRTKRIWQGTVAAAMVLAASAGLWMWRSSAAAARARESLLPEIERLAAEDKYAEAYALAEQAERVIPTDPLLLELWPTISANPAIDTTPSDAEVFVREYPTSGQSWRRVGSSPLTGVRLPKGLFEWKLEKRGFEPLTFAAANPSNMLRNFGIPGQSFATYDFSLVPAGEAPQQMAIVPAGRASSDLNGLGVTTITDLQRFFIDKHEIRNREFKEFVDAGGYSTASHWAGLQFVKDGRELSFNDANRFFVDKTGRPGPAGWELSDYPREQDEYPVTGVSWYEAAAYCAFRGKTLPTIYHFARAATSWDVTHVLVPASNFAGVGLAPAGKYRGIGSYGTYDMFGNAREWIWNGAAGNRWILGGAWNEAPYQATQRNSLPPFDRAATNGFRCMKYEQDAHRTQQLTAPLNIVARDFRNAEPISTELREVFAGRFAYEPGELNARVEWTDDTHREYVRQRVTFDGGYGQRTPLHLFIPKKGKPPFRTIVYFPGVYAFFNPGPSDKMLTAFPGPEDFVVKTGFALAWPVYDNSFERWKPAPPLTGAELRRHNLVLHAHRRQDLGRTLDYLQTRADVRGDGLVYFGFSQGAGPAFFLAALENRFKAAILLAGGIQSGAPAPEVLALNYAPLMKMPVLMLNGKYDHVYPLETSVKPLFEQLGTPGQHKRLLTFEAGHYPLPRAEWIPEAIAWIEKYVPALPSER